MIELVLRFDDVSEDILTAIAVEAKSDERISLEVDIGKGTVTINSTDVTGLKAAMNTIFRMIETAEGVRAVLDGEQN